MPAYPSYSALIDSILEAFAPAGANPWSGQKIEDKMRDIVQTVQALSPSVISSTSYLDKPVPIKYGLNLKAFGNSITQGAQATNFNDAYAPRLASLLGGTITNLGVSGFTSKQALTLINQSNELPNTRNYVTSWMLGINDILFSLANSAKFANIDAARMTCGAMLATIEPPRSHVKAVAKTVNMQDDWHAEGRPRKPSN
jgi:hypothetical protein